MYSTDRNFTVVKENSFWKLSETGSFYIPTSKILMNGTVEPNVLDVILGNEAFALHNFHCPCSVTDLDMKKKVFNYCLRWAR